MKVAIWHHDEEAEYFYDILRILEDFEFVGYIFDTTDLSKDKYEKTDLFVIPAVDQFQFRRIIQALHKAGIQYADKLYISTLSNLIKRMQKYKRIAQIIEINRIPYIPSLEYEASKSCNLNCKRCNHFSNLQPKGKLADFNSFKKDLARVNEYIEEIGTFYLLGGEPLLNTELNKYIEYIKMHFTKTRIVIITNGILITGMSKKLIHSIVSNQVSLGISFYPLVSLHLRIHLRMGKYLSAVCLKI